MAPPLAPSSQPAHSAFPRTPPAPSGRPRSGRHVLLPPQTTGPATPRRSFACLRSVAILPLHPESAGNFLHPDSKGSPFFCYLVFFPIPVLLCLVTPPTRRLPVCVSPAP